MTYDASNRKDIRRAEKAAQRAVADRIEFLRLSLSSIGGRSWFHSLLSDLHLFSDPFTGDPYHEAYLKGERNVGLRIFADIVAHCPDQYLLMMREAAVREQVNARDTAERTSSEDDGRDTVGSDSEPDEYIDPYGP